jgi:hypothetical protein
MKQPARLHKVERVSLLDDDFETWILLHPAAVLIGIGIAILLGGALVFAVTGNSTVESGAMRNFIATGV